MPKNKQGLSQRHSECSVRSIKHSLSFVLSESGQQHSGLGAQGGKYEQKFKIGDYFMPVLIKITEPRMISNSLSGPRSKRFHACFLVFVPTFATNLRGNKRLPRRQAKSVILSSRD